MKKKTLVFSVIVTAVLVVILLGGYAFFNSVFPKAGPMKQLEISLLESISLHDNSDNEIEISDTELQKLIDCINGAVATRTMSVNDYPDVRPYYVLEIKTAERVIRYMIYERNGIAYAEIPYEGVYKIDREAIDIVK